MMLRLYRRNEALIIGTLSLVAIGLSGNSPSMPA